MLYRWLPHAHDAYELFGLSILALQIEPGGKLLGEMGNTTL